MTTNKQQNAEKAQKWSNLIQALGKSCSSEITTDEIDAFVKKLSDNGKNAKIVDEIRDYLLDVPIMITESEFIKICRDKLGEKK